MSDKDTKQIIQRFLKLPYENRKIRIKKVRQARGNYRVSDHKFTPDEIIDYIKDNKLTRQCDLIRLHEANVETPSLYFVKQVFESWKNAISLAYTGQLALDITPKKTDEDIIRLISDYKIKTARQYLKFREKDPAVFPSIYEVLRRFGYWLNLRRLACGYSIENILGRYISLRRRLNKWPSKKECQNANVEIERLLEVMTRNDLRELVVTLENYYEKQGKSRK